jgi:hypothetical protein
MWRIGILLAFIAAAVVMAYQIGSRLSDDAIMTIVGVACGILASIPVSIGLLIALTRERASYAAEEYMDAEPEPAPAPYHVYKPAPPQLPVNSTQPQIIVVAPNPYGSNATTYPNGTPYPQLAPFPNSLPAPMQERNFKIVGEDEGE